MCVPLFADIILPLSLNNIYTYSIPEEFGDVVKPGFRVIVGLGKRKLYTGIVAKVHKDTPSFETKEILSVQDSIPFMCKQQIQLIKWISDYYCCSQGEVLNAAIPSTLIPSSGTKVFLVDNDNNSYCPSSSEVKILDFLKNAGESDIFQITLATQISNPMRLLENLSLNGLISLNQKMGKSYKPVYSDVIVFDNMVLDNNTDLCEKILAGNNRQKDVLSFLVNDKIERNLIECEYPIKAIVEKFGISKSVLVSLEKKGLLRIEKREYSRYIYEERGSNNTFQLTDNQQNTYEYINDRFKEKKPVLLHGVTSSGKTEIYIKLIEQKLKENKEILYLLPEIAMTSQIIERLQKYFGNKIGVFHSKYSANSRAEVYIKILKKEIKIILGVRSAVFLPFSNLGLIIIDEEHESTYKQNDPDPRYNARDVSLVLANIHKANIVLGSATPSIESYQNAVSGKYALVELNERYGKVKVPEILIADMKEAYRKKMMNSYFHPLLTEEIINAIANNQQVILFQNRRGYAPTLECADCGWVPYCRNCNVSLNYHKYENKLVCHYCGEKYDLLNKCASCGSSKIKLRGLGTERLEEEAARLFPQAKIVRFDYDTANSRIRFEKIVKSFENHEYDILIGTQMVSKGFDFENVALVGILNADNMLNFPDFRAFERAYQLMTQVSGRAGRRKIQGKVIIQTYNPEHQVIKNVVSNDYLSLFSAQVEERKQFNYPPFWNFIIIKLKHKDKRRLYRGALALADSLKSEFSNRVKGPQEPLVNKISNYFYLTIHLRFEKELSSQKVKKKVMEMIHSLKSESEFGSIITEIDVDPM
ncbi:MAG TPA: primosomal protein N' [Bacteroidales bacterium]|nr:primosomal protein N' [Bacteroidales bacterium]